MSSLHPRWRRLAHGCALIVLALAGCGHELSRSLAPGPENRIDALGRGGAAAGEAATGLPASGSNVPPLATILSPAPTSGFTPTLDPPVTIEWTGQDPEGHLREYRYRVFGKINPDFPAISDFVAYLQLNPEAVLDHYAPDFAGWESMRVRRGPERASATYPNLALGTAYAFVVVAIDHRKDHDPDLSPLRNLLVFSAAVSPLADITFRGPFGVVTGPTGRVDVPSGVPVTISWSAAPRIPGMGIVGYRSGFGIPLAGEPSLADTTASFPPSVPGTLQLLYVEVHLTNGQIALGILAVRFTDAPLAAASRWRSRAIYD